ncbi:hypothetical protein [Novacetimonas cocois]|uniref:WXG100 family type VII secretion target n=1 Tax=Novacetimonas cocois TaxID=1747507 RepID=A0A365YYT9_9PROT|nr:hypothetical protein [Novacetimonas cocois]RBM07730.1 hypothetical protein NJLHNGOC_06820 [Novacetimonas cocois]
MSSLDDTYVQMGDFEQKLAEFSEVLARSLVDLTRQHEQAMAVWGNDRSAVAYNRSWEELSDALMKWSQGDAPAYLGFINQKRHILRQFLESGR